MIKEYSHERELMDENKNATDTAQSSGTAGYALGWAMETMMMINNLTPDIKGKAFDIDWFLLRQRLDEAGTIIDKIRTA